MQKKIELGVKREMSARAKRSLANGRSSNQRIAAAVMSIGLSGAMANAATDTWASAAGTSWVNGPWSSGAQPAVGDIAQFGATGTATTIGISFSSANNGSGAESLGAIDVTSARGNALTVNDSSSTVSGTLTFTGATVLNALGSGVADVIVHTNTSKNLTLAPGSGGIMSIALADSTNNIILVENSGNVTISSNIGQASAGKVLTIEGGGSGTVTLSGTDSFSGGLVAAGGEVDVSADANLGAAGGSITINGGRLGIATNSFTIDPTRAILLGANPTGSNTSGNLSIKGSITTVYNSALQNLNGSTTGDFVKQGGGTLQLGGSSTYSGTTFINNGVVQLTTAPNRLPTGTVVNIGQSASTNTGTLDLNGNNQTVAGLASTTGSGTFTTVNTVTSTNTATLTINTSGSNSYTYGSSSATNSGIIAGAGLSLLKTGSGTETLGGSSTYGGSTVVSAGTLALNSAGSINGTSGITVNGTGATFLQTSSAALTKTVTLTKGTVDGTGLISAVTVGDGTGGVVSAGNGAAGTLSITTLTFNGAGNITLANNEIVSAGTLQVGAVNPSGIVSLNASGASWTNGTFYDLLNFGNTLTTAQLADIAKGTITGTNTRQNATLTTPANGAPAGEIGYTISGDSPAWTGADNGNWTTASTGPNHNWKLIGGGTATDYISGDDVLFDDTHLAPGGATTVNISDASVTPNSVTFNNSSNSYTVTSAGGYGINGGASLLKTGSGLLALNTSNSYSGGTVISGGTVRLGADGALPSAGSVTLANVAGLLLDVNGHVETATELSGGGTTGGNVALGGGTLTVGDSHNFTYSGIISDAGGNASGTTGSLIKAGSGTMTLTSVETYGGSTTISAGTIALDAVYNETATIPNTPLTVASGALFQLNGQQQAIQRLSGAGTVSMNKVIDGASNSYVAALTVGDATNTTFSGTLSGSGNLIKRGSGSLSLTGGTVSYTGTTTLSAGTLTLAPVATGAISLSAPSGGNALNGTLVLGSAVEYDFNDNSGTGANPFSGTGSIQVTKSAAIITNTGSTPGASIQVPISLNPTGAATFHAGDVTQSSFSPSAQFVTNINGTTSGKGIVIDVNSGISGYSDVDISNSLTGGGAGALALNAASTYTGTTEINSNGSIVLGLSNALPVTTDVVVNNLGKTNSKLDLHSFNQQFDSLSDGNPSNNTASNHLTILNSAPGTTSTLTISGSTTPFNGFSHYITDGAGTVAVVKDGSSAWTITGSSNTYSGGTQIKGGTLFVNNTGSSSGTGAGPVTVIGGTLSGSGTIAGAVEVKSSATIASGGTATGTGSLAATGGVTFDAGGTYTPNLTSTTGSNPAASELKITGGWTINGPFTIKPSDNGTAMTVTLGEQWAIAKADSVNSTDTSQFTLDTSNLAVTGGSPGGSFSLQFLPDASSGEDLDVVYSAAPEPGTAMLVLLGAARFWRHAVAAAPLRLKRPRISSGPGIIFTSSVRHATWEAGRLKGEKRGEPRELKSPWRVCKGSMPNGFSGAPEPDDQMLAADVRLAACHPVKANGLGWNSTCDRLLCRCS